MVRSDLNNFIIDSFFALLRYAVHATDDIPQIKLGEWLDIFEMSQKQALTGVVFEGVQRMNRSVAMPRDIVLKWVFLAERIKQRNVLLNQRCVELIRKFQEDGFQCCILKGQGNTLMYSNPYSRTPGDIDLFLLPQGGMSVQKRRKAVTEYVRRCFPKTRIRYQHIDYPVFPDVEVEVHFIPTAKNNPIYNWRIQQWVERIIKAQCANIVSLPENLGEISVPTVEFNVIYQLSHLMHHFFDEGIGLRQFIDYYYVLKQFEEFKKSRNEELHSTLRYLGLWKFAGAVMYVMQEVFQLGERYMIAPVDERRGKTLMNEILKGGNFGKFSGLTNHSKGQKYFLKHWRSLHFVWEYPAEALCEPIFRTWHFFWRLVH